MIELIFIWLLYVVVVSQFLPILMELAGYLLVFLLECLWIAVRTVMRGIGFGFYFVGRTIWRALNYRRLAREAYEREPRNEKGRTAAEQAAFDYMFACLCFELEEGQFDRETFERAYRNVIAEFLPDRLDRPDWVDEVNRQRDVIYRRHGWA